MANYRIIKVTTKGDDAYYVPQKKQYFLGFIPYWKSPNYFIGLGHHRLVFAQQEMHDWIDNDNKARKEKLSTQIKSKEVMIQL